MNMRAPLDRYGPQPEGEPPFGGSGGDGLRWLQWLQLAITSALVVMFVYQGMELQSANRRIARLYERLDLSEQTNIKSTSAQLEAQQLILTRRLQDLEAKFLEADLERKSPVETQEGPSALKAPSPPKPLP